MKNTLLYPAPIKVAGALPNSGQTCCCFTQLQSKLLLLHPTPVKLVAALPKLSQILIHRTRSNSEFDPGGSRHLVQLLGAETPDIISPNSDTDSD